MDRTTMLAASIAALLVAGAALVGLGVARLATASPTRTPAATATLPALPTDPPDTSELVFRQPLTTGCATSRAVWVVSDGGGMARYDGTTWSLVDPTLRTLASAACTADVMYAVGAAGRVITADDQERSIRPDALTIEDLNGISLIEGGALVVGTHGTIYAQDAQGWMPYARGIDEDLYGVAAFGPVSAWAVGAGGVTYRLEERGWRPFPSGVTTTLRAVVGGNPGDVVAVGDAGVVLHFVGGAWRRIDAGVSADLRAAVRYGSAVWAVGGDGVVLAIDPARDVANRVELGTTCPLRGIFAVRTSELWFVGSSGTRGAVWHRAADTTVRRWGAC